MLIGAKQPGKLGYYPPPPTANHLSQTITTLCVHEYIITHTHQETAAARRGVSRGRVGRFRTASFYSCVTKLTFASFSPSSRFTARSCVESAYGHTIDTQVLSHRVWGHGWCYKGKSKDSVVHVWCIRVHLYQIFLDLNILFHRLDIFHDVLS